MDYFVSIENTAYDLWQIELLIESFKMRNLQDDLIIAVAGQYTAAKNLSQQKKIVVHEPHQYHSIYGLLAALYSETLKQPFVMLHPDMLLHQPFYDEWRENIVFHPYVNDLEITRPFVTSGVIRFNLVPYKFFQIVLNKAKELADENIEKEKNIVKAAWTDTIYTSSIFFDVTGRPLEVPLLAEELNAPFVHYRDGLMPVFDKNMLKRQIALTDKNPFEILLEHNPTIVTNYMTKVIKSYQGEKSI